MEALVGLKSNTHGRCYLETTEFKFRDFCLPVALTVVKTEEY